MSAAAPAEVSGSAEATTPAQATGPRAAFERAVEAYLLQLRVERGLAPRTRAAYRSDLHGFAGAAPGFGGWARGPEPARAYLALLGQPPRSCRPATRRRKAAAIRAFYRFAFAEELIDGRRGGPPGPPAPGAPPARSARRGRGVAAARRAPAADEPAGLRDRALLELLYASGLRIGEATGLDRQDLSLDGGYVRVIGKGDRERLVPVGDAALGGPRALPRNGAPGWLGGRGRVPRPCRAAARSSSSRAGPAPGPHGGLASRAGRGAPRGPARPTSLRIRFATVSPRTCWKVARTCASSRSCWDMPASARPSCTRI